ncbi:MAG: hypothetical protein ABH854_02375 [Candidatus Diapherotrites archaeon]|nr:hypothetical protein [Candidatus Micrarchaeota archaeon]MBU1939304.1 hypothetical protein [Candidatus Micrarchaeota archaeon]
MAWFKFWKKKGTLGKRDARKALGEVRYGLAAIEFDGKEAPEKRRQAGMEEETIRRALAGGLKGEHGVRTGRMLDNYMDYHARKALEEVRNALKGFDSEIPAGRNPKRIEFEMKQKAVNNMLSNRPGSDWTPGAMEALREYISFNRKKLVKEDKHRLRTLNAFVEWQDGKRTRKGAFSRKIGEIAQKIRHGSQLPTVVLQLLEEEKARLKDGGEEKNAELIFQIEMATAGERSFKRSPYAMQVVADVYRILEREMKENEKTLKLRKVILFGKEIDKELRGNVEETKKNLQELQKHASVNERRAGLLNNAAIEALKKEEMRLGFKMRNVSKNGILEELGRKLEKIRVAQRGGIALMHTPEARATLEREYKSLQEELLQKQKKLNGSRNGPKKIFDREFAEIQKIRKDLHSLQPYLRNRAA